ncbi:MAG: hypothetical protein QXX55_00690 [Candidatus Pacearchaeota archaeon]
MKKIKGINSKAYLLTFFLIGTILIINLISAAGVATPYWRENPLRLAPGESTIITLSLQNMVGGEDIRFKIDLSSTSNVVSLVDQKSEYFVPFGENNVPVKLKINLPENAPIGEIYSVQISFQQISSGEGGMIKIASGISTEIPILVVEKNQSVLREIGEQKTTGNNKVIILIVIIVILVAVLFFIKNKKYKKK